MPKHQHVNSHYIKKNWLLLETHGIFFNIEQLRNLWQPTFSHSKNYDNQHTWNLTQYFWPIWSKIKLRRENLVEWENFIIFQRQITNFYNSTTYLFSTSKNMPTSHWQTVVQLPRIMWCTASHVRLYGPRNLCQIFLLYGCN